MSCQHGRERDVEESFVAAKTTYGTRNSEKLAKSEIELFSVRLNRNLNTLRFVRNRRNLQAKGYSEIKLVN